MISYIYVNLSTNKLYHYFGVMDDVLLLKLKSDTTITVARTELVAVSIFKIIKSLILR